MLFRSRTRTDLWGTLAILDYGPTSFVFEDRQRVPLGVNMHLKVMIFAGQNTVEFGSANYSPDAFVPVTPYTNYVSETIFFEDDPVIVNSFKTKVDNIWTDTTNYSNYANISSRVRVYPTYPISSVCWNTPFALYSSTTGRGRGGTHTR